MVARVRCARPTTVERGLSGDVGGHAAGRGGRDISGCFGMRTHASGQVNARGQEVKKRAKKEAKGTALLDQLFGKRERVRIDPRCPIARRRLDAA